MALAFTAVAGVAAVAEMRGVQLDRGKADGKEQSGASGGEPEGVQSCSLKHTNAVNMWSLV